MSRMKFTRGEFSKKWAGWCVKTFLGDPLCHVATSFFEALCHVATSFGHLLCHVATWIHTSRRRLVMHSATSRREPERRDVGLFALCHVATSPPHVAT